MKFPHNSRVCPPDQAHDAPFGAAIRTDIADFHQHAIAVHGRPHEGRWNENVPSQLRFQALVERVGFRNHKPEAVAMHAQPAHRHVPACGGLRNGVAVGPDLLKLSPGRQVFQTLEQLAAGVPVDPEFTRQLLEARGAFGLLLDFLQDGGVGKHGDGVSRSRIPELDWACCALQEARAGKYFC